MAYYYKIKSLGGSSDKYGVCEVCKKPVSDMHYQEETKDYMYDRETLKTSHECNTLFGHKNCLEMQRR